MMLESTNVTGRMPRTAVVVIGVVLSLIHGCAKRDKRDEVVLVKDDDAEMTAAITKARTALPQFWRAFDNRERGETGFALKVRITDPRGTEHFWATDVERRDGKTIGTINNDPNIVKSVKLGDRVEIPEADISDWMYMRDGKMVGNETMKPLLKKMPAVEAERYKKMMVEP
jgi:uncharacterized protein YegJ (DUF2314 family)